MTAVWLVDAEGNPAELPPAPSLVLLHFTVPYRHAGHVLVRGGGRLHELAGLAAAAGAVQIARVWTGSEQDVLRTEVKVRNAGSRARYCPVCRDAAKVQPGA